MSLLIIEEEKLKSMLELCLTGSIGSLYVVSLPA